MLSISTCWNSHRHHEDGLHMVYEALLMGFEHMELSHGLSPVLLPGFYDVHNKESRCGSTEMDFTGVRNCCPEPTEEPSDYGFTSQSSQQREISIGLAKKSIDVAADLGGHYVVLPLGQAPMSDHTTRLSGLVNEGHLYSKSYAALKLEMIQEHERLDRTYLDGVRMALDELIPHAEEKEIRLGLECGAHYEDVPNEREMELLLNEYDSPTVCYWHDFGHIQLKENLGLLDHRQWLEKMLPRLIGSHIHDVNWPSEDHCIPFRGCIDFDQLIPLLPNNIPMVWEINSHHKSDDIKEALINWKEKYGD